MADSRIQYPPFTGRHTEEETVDRETSSSFFESDTPESGLEMSSSKGLPDRLRPSNIAAMYEMQLKMAVEAFYKGQHTNSDAICHQLLWKSDLPTVIRAWCHMLIALNCEDRDVHYHAQEAVKRFKAVSDAYPDNAMHSKYLRISERHLTAIERDMKDEMAEKKWRAGLEVVAPTNSLASEIANLVAPLMALNKQEIIEFLVQQIEENPNMTIRQALEKGFVGPHQLSRGNNPQGLGSLA